MLWPNLDKFPPYLPTPDDVVVEFTAPPNDDDNTSLWDGSLIAAAWAGGTHGRRVVDRAVPQILGLDMKPMLHQREILFENAKREYLKKCLGNNGNFPNFLVCLFDQQLSL